MRKSNCSYWKKLFVSSMQQKKIMHNKHPVEKYYKHKLFWLQAFRSKLKIMFQLQTGHFNQQKNSSQVFRGEKWMGNEWTRGQVVNHECQIVSSVCYHVPNHVITRIIFHSKMRCSHPVIFILQSVHDVMIYWTFRVRWGAATHVSLFTNGQSESKLNDTPVFNREQPLRNDVKKFEKERQQI